MGQEFIIKSQTLEDKVNQLLPSQGGFQAGVDLSASTTIIPIVDLTESAEGSNLRADLLSAVSHDGATVFSVANATTTVINTTGYWRILGASTISAISGNNISNQIILNDGTTDKVIWGHIQKTTGTGIISALNIDFNVFLNAGDSIIVKSNGSTGILTGSIRQLASIDGTLVNP